MSSLRSLLSRKVKGFDSWVEGKAYSTDAEYCRKYREWFHQKVRSIRHGGRLEPMPGRVRE